MTRPYSNDLRERALARVEKGETIRSVAAALAVSPSCVSKWWTRKRRTGNVAPGKIGGHKKRTLSGRSPTGCARACGLGVHAARPRGGAGRAGREDRGAGCLGFSPTPRGSVSKKTLVASEQTRPDVARKRTRWKARASQRRS